MYTKPENTSEKANTPRKAMTVLQLAKMKQAGEKIACLTAYDASFAALLDNAGIDLLLVGDTLGMVIQGRDSTLPVSVDDIVYHTQAVARGNRLSFLVADMPFNSYSDPVRAVDNAARMMAEGGAQMVKLEATANQEAVISALAGQGIPTCAHLGLRPQSVHKLGGFKVQGKEQAAAKQMQADAQALEAAGADLLLLECVPSALAAEITRTAHVPVIGIGAGPDTDGQILVLYDMLNITPGKKPRFAKNYLTPGETLDSAVQCFIKEVKTGAYPQPEHGFE
ncbi:MAG TPA: 3-methyl-2-oxobutanoate hydroxymethyltransferase [Gammaproteobacteria bacterium]|nr:3-methyl-2-oxobutanoate hydroxymethyltransferase [Gammaproteobacteria bacterium]